MATETTLVLLKPDCVTRRLCGEVIRRLEGLELDIVGIKWIRFDEALLRTHYAHIIDRPFFPKFSLFMTSAPVMALALSGEEAIARVRHLFGPTDSRLAPKGTVRGDFGVDAMVNMVHASDSPASAATELGRFFAGGELFRR
jgi:nucleoside-diphosphate kinase